VTEQSEAVVCLLNNLVLPIAAVGSDDTDVEHSLLLLISYDSTPIICADSLVV